MSGDIVCHLTTGETVIKTKNGYYMDCTPVVPLYDYKNGELVGFFNPEEVNVEIVED